MQNQPPSFKFHSPVGNWPFSVEGIAGHIYAYLGYVTLRNLQNVCKAWYYDEALRKRIKNVGLSKGFYLNEVSPVVGHISSLYSPQQNPFSLRQISQFILKSLPFGVKQIVIKSTKHSFLVLDHNGKIHRFALKAARGYHVKFDH